MESVPLELRGPEYSVVPSGDVCRLWCVSAIRFTRLVAAGEITQYSDPLDSRHRLYKVGDLDKLFARRSPEVWVDA